ncbi:MAG: 50S ribosomal protein L6 [Methanobacteriota archaeon]
MTAVTEIKEEVKIPTGVELTFEKNTLQVKGSKGVNTRVFWNPKIQITIQKDKVIILCNKSPHRAEKALLGTYAAHIRNMIKGVTDGYEYKMKTVYSHFPIKTAVEGNTFIIQNFLGERSPRKAKILEGVKVAIQGDLITLSGINIEQIGQTAANIERAAKVKNRDVRVFQDGVYIISGKGGKP